MKTACIVQARMGSKRLPGKVMLPLNGEPIIRHVLRRCQQIPGVDVVVCAVPDEPRSKPIVKEAMSMGVGFYPGPEQDVLLRYYLAAMAAKADIVIRVTADCPFILPEVCGDVLDLLKTSGADYASNVFPERTFPKGRDCQAFTFNALKQAVENATDPYDREHVCPYMERNMKTALLAGPGDDGMSFCVDTPDDYERMKWLYDSVCREHEYILIKNNLPELVHFRCKKCGLSLPT